MVETDLTARVDQVLLAATFRLHRNRGVTVRGALHDFFESSKECLADSIGTSEESIWRLRVDRASYMLTNWNDDELRREARAAHDRDERGR